MIGLPSTSWFAERFPRYVDRWLPCGTCPGLPESTFDPEAHARFLGAARASRFDLAIQMHGDGRVTNGFTAALGAVRWGGLRPSAIRDGRHEIDRCLDAACAAGIPIDHRDHELEFGLHDRDAEELRALVTDVEEPAVVVHPGASRAERRWPQSSFAALARHLAASGDRVVLTGTPAERAVTIEIAALAGAPVIDLAGRTSIGALAALVASARLVVANDTGVVHLAVALGTPTVTVFGRSDRGRWEARGHRHRAVGGESGGWPTVEAVAAACDEQLLGAA